MVTTDHFQTDTSYPSSTGAVLVREAPDDEEEEQDEEDDNHEEDDDDGDDGYSE